MVCVALFVLFAHIATQFDHSVVTQAILQMYVIKLILSFLLRLVHNRDACLILSPLRSGTLNPKSQFP